MNVRLGMLVSLTAAVGTLAGCIAPKERHFQNVQQSVQQASGYQVRWYEGRPEDLMVTENIRRMLAEPLTLRSAVQIALLNNPILQGQYEEIGIAQGDLVQASLPKNPALWVRTRWPDREPTKHDFETALTQDILDLFLLPVRKKLAARHLEQVKLRLSQTILDTINDVRANYYTLQATEQVHVLRQEMIRITRIAGQQAQAGQGFAPLNEVDRTSLLVTSRRAEINHAISEADVQIARANLQKLMGIPDSPNWTVSIELPLPPPGYGLTLQELEAMALANRLDLKATHFDLTSPSIALARMGVLGSVFAIVDAEHGPGGTNLTGPAFQTDIPILNWNQGRISRLKSASRQGTYNVMAASIQVQYEVRTAYAHLASTRTAVDMYRMSMLPLQEHMTELSQEKQGPTPNLTDYLQVQQGSNDVQREYINLLRDFWIAQAEMERAIGAELPVPQASASQPAPGTQPEQEMPPVPSSNP